jgi:transcriptional regulator with XRE-family HTH domain
MNFKLGGIMSTERRSTAVDAYVGKKLKQRREGLGLSQEKLAELLGISFQQIQKYERGLNRVGASRLFQLCGVMSVEPGFFFDGLSPTAPVGMAEPVAIDPLSTAALLSAPGALDLLAEYARLKSAGQRKKVVELVRLIASDDTD